MITTQDFEDAPEYSERWLALMERAANGEELSLEVREEAKREAAEREARLDALAKADVLADAAKREEFFQKMRNGMDYVNAANAIGSSGYLVLGYTRRDPAFRTELRALLHDPLAVYQECDDTKFD